MQFAGSIDHFDRRVIRGWARFNGEKTEDAPLSFAVRFDNPDVIFELKTLQRQDVEGTGFEVWLNQKTGHSFADILDAFQSVTVSVQFEGRTVSERLQFYKSCLRPIQDLPVSVIHQQRSPRIALLLRTHIENERVFEACERLSQVPGVDFYVVADETRQKLDFSPYRQLPHSAANFGDMGLLSNGSFLLWHCGDYPLYSAYWAMPNYDYYCMIEYDVYVKRPAQGETDPLKDLVARVVAAKLDLCGFALSQRTQPHWTWAEHAASVFGSDPSRVWGMLFPIVIISRRALVGCLHTRLMETARRTVYAEPKLSDIAYCEYFVPECVSRMQDSIIRSIESIAPRFTSQQYFTVNIPIHYRSEILSQLPVDAAHPVLADVEYLKKSVFGLKSKGELAKTLESLEIFQPQPDNVRFHQRTVAELKRRLAMAID